MKHSQPLPMPMTGLTTDLQLEPRCQLTSSSYASSQPSYPLSFWTQAHMNYLISPLVSCKRLDSDLWFLTSLFFNLALLWKSIYAWHLLFNFIHVSFYMLSPIRYKRLKFAAVAQDCLPNLICPIHLCTCGWISIWTAHALFLCSISVCVTSGQLTAVALASQGLHPEACNVWTYPLIVARKPGDGMRTPSKTGEASMVALFLSQVSYGHSDWHKGT